MFHDKLNNGPAPGRADAVMANIETVAVQGYRPDGTVFYWNAGSRRLYGYSREEALGQSILELMVPPEIHDFARRAIREMVETASPWPAEELILMRKDGSRVPVLSNHTVIIGPDGQAELFCVDVDLSERKAVEQELLRERLRLEGIIDGTNVGTWEWNVQTGETVFNHRWAEILGYTLADLEPVSIETWERLLHPDDEETVAEALQRHFAGEADLFAVEVRLRHKDGSWVWVLDSGKVISRTNDGQPLLMMGSHREITERKRAQEEMTRLARERETLLRELQHRIKNNMNTMMSLLSLQLERVADDVAREALQEAASRFRSMQVLYDHLYRNDTDGTALLGEYLEDLVREVVSLFPGGASVDLVMQIEPLELSMKVLSDAGLVVNELVTNAMKYAFRGRHSGVLKVMGEKRDGVVRITIEDDGPGLAATDGGEAGGAAGFGMTLIEALTQQLGGTITFSEGPGLRAVITVHHRVGQKPLHEAT